MTELKLGTLARAGFTDLSAAKASLLKLAASAGGDAPALLEIFAVAADPDSALDASLLLSQQHPEIAAALTGEQWRNFALLSGASAALTEFYQRHPEKLGLLLQTGGAIHTPAQYREALLRAVRAADGEYSIAQPGWVQLRVAYREQLAALMLWDLAAAAQQQRTPQHLELVAAALAALADAALEAALAVARATLVSGRSPGLPVPAADAAQVPLAIIAMGKCGAQELNVVSDVDVLFITQPVTAADDESHSNPGLDGDRLLRAATRLASETMRVIHDPAAEPPLWEIDPNLRPEGKNGPLVRTLQSYLSYYQRWAETWEFQALLKARAAAGDLALGTEFVAAITPAVWDSRNRPDFVGNVQRMRERVTEHLDPEDVEHQIKLGPGGLRDIEFSVQLLQLVHGAHDHSLRTAATLPALQALSDHGYIARTDAEELAEAYAALRLFEHRLQLRDLRRTALMPRDEEELRVLARSTGYRSAQDLTCAWEHIKRRVRSLHLKIFYAPLLSAVAALPLNELTLTNDAAADRLRSIGFKDPAGALRHLKALTAGSRRSAQIQRTLLPVFIQWLADGADPDGGLLAFRRISEANGANPWYLRLLRDGAEAAERLMRVLSGSRYAAELLEQLPEAVAWLEENHKLQPAEYTHLQGEMAAVAARRDTLAAAATALRQIHKREVLRLALGQLSGVNDAAAVARGLDAAHTALLEVLLQELQKRDEQAAQLDFALIAMGRFGGGELGFASDLDLLAVYRAPADFADASRVAIHTITQLRQLAADPFSGVELDFDLRPEGKNGALVRTLEGYRAYYEKWSLTWEAQALLRARFIAGDAALGAVFMQLADTVRYPASFTVQQQREVRLLKARMESERLPQGVQPQRHLKLGPGGVSDTEWLVQLLQLQHAHGVPELQTQQTLSALATLRQRQIISASAEATLAHSWILASQLRSALKLWSGRNSDVLPADRDDLDGIGRILGRKADTTTELEAEWFAAARKSRRIFEELFYDETGGF